MVNSSVKEESEKSEEKCEAKKTETSDSIKIVDVEADYTTVSAECCVLLKPCSFLVETLLNISAVRSNSWRYPHLQRRPSRSGEI